MTTLRHNREKHRYEARLTNGRYLAIHEAEINQSLLYAYKEGREPSADEMREVHSAETWLPLVEQPGRNVWFFDPFDEAMKEQERQERAAQKHAQAKAARKQRLINN